MFENSSYLYDKAIHDCEWRIGSYIASGGSSEDEYVKTQIKKIRFYTGKILGQEETTND